MTVQPHPSPSAQGRSLTDVTDELVSELKKHALIKKRVQLSSGQWASYYVDAKRVLLCQPGASLVGRLVAAKASHCGATSVGGLTMGADPIVSAAIACDQVLTAFLVRKDRKPHGLERWIEGPQMNPGSRCLIVDDVVTSGGSVIDAVKRVREHGFEVAGVVAVVDRLAGGREAIEQAAGAAYTALTTIDDVYPDRPDR